MNVNRLRVRDIRGRGGGRQGVRDPLPRARRQDGRVQEGAAQGGHAAASGSSQCTRPLLRSILSLGATCLAGRSHYSSVLVQALQHGAKQAASKLGLQTVGGSQLSSVSAAAALQAAANSALFRTAAISPYGTSECEYSSTPEPKYEYNYEISECRVVSCRVCRIRSRCSIEPSGIRILSSRPELGYSRSSLWERTLTRQEELRIRFTSNPPDYRAFADGRVDSVVDCRGLYARDGYGGRAGGTGGAVDAALPTGGGCRASGSGKLCRQLLGTHWRAHRRLLHTRCVQLYEYEYRSERWSLGTHSHITSEQSRCSCSFF